MNIEEAIEKAKEFINYIPLGARVISFRKGQFIDCQIAFATLLTAYEKEKEKNKEHKEKIIYWLDRLDLEEELQDEYDELDGCQAAVKILKQLLKEE